MELENLKKLWHQLDTTETSVKASEIQAMLHHQSNDALAKLKYRLFWDIMVGGASIMLFVIVGILSTDIAWKITGGFMLFVYAPFVLMGWREYRKLQKVSFSNINLREQLSQLISYWEKGLDKSFKIQQFLVPIGSLLGFWAGANWGGNGDFIGKMLNRPLVFKTFLIWAFVISVLALMLWGANWYLKWYLRAVFGSQVKRLKECLQALAEE
ncbi:MAG: hypothetical protein MUE85_24365 [Microscillaceae bacterium]|jgi:ABC-type antimicrobial peptide transport system permease subunit|nr:hypothetical protein [Microscillaceae bacterium]